MTEQPRSRVFLWVLLGGGAFFLFLVAMFALVYFTVRTQQKDSFAGFGDKIGVVDLEGVILSPKDMVEQLRKYADDSSIKAIIIHVNSPGGGAAASEEIYREVLRIRDVKKKRIVASIETVGASGAYYRFLGHQQDLRRQRQHRRLHRRHRRVVQLRRIDEVGEAAAHHD